MSINISLKEYVNVGALKEKYEELKIQYNQKLQELREIEKNLKFVENLLIQLGEIQIEIPQKPQKIENVGVRGEKINSVVEYIEGLPAGKTFTFKDIVDATGSGRGTVWSAINKALADGLIEKVAHGLYKRK